MANFPERPRQPHLDVPFPNKIGIKVAGQDPNNVSISKHFEIPQDHDEYVKWEKDQAKKLKYYQKELNFLVTKSERPAETFPDAYLWRRLIELAVEIEWWHLMAKLENDIIQVAKKMALRSA